MKLDVNALRYLSKDDFRVLTAVEMGQKNHEIVPMQLVDSISGLKHGGAFRSLKTLLQHKLVHHDGQKYDGYRLTYMGYDFLAIKALVARGHISGVGRQIGVGKESDIFEVTNDDGEVFALKLHRLGRTSFRDVKSKRDYLGNRSSYSWLYLSRLAALKEFAFMKALGDHGFPVPVAIDNNRHAVLMELVDGQPLVQVREVAHPAAVYSQAMGLIYRLACCGLIHCDFNEFNLLINEEEELTLIDFPQMVSVSHANAQELFERDVECIIRFFNKKIGYMPQLDESLSSYRPDFEAAVAEAAAAGASGLDVELAASGFNKQHQKALEEALEAAGAVDEAGGEDEEESEEGDEESEEEAECAEAADGAAAAAGTSIRQQQQEEESQEVVGVLANRLAAAGAAADGPSSSSRSSGSRNAVQQQQQQGSASMHRWLEEHAVLHNTSSAAAAAAAAGRSDGSGSSSSSAEEEEEEEQDDGGCSSGNEAGSNVKRGDGAAAAAAAQAPKQQQQQWQTRQQQQWEQSSVAAPSHAGTDVSFMGREVQQRLVAQRQKASARAAAAKATRNVSKAKGKHARKAAAAMADW